MNLKLVRVVIIAFFSAGLLSACTPARIAVNPTLWQQKTARVGVAVVKYPEPAAYKIGAQGLLDIAINAALAADLKAHLLTLKPDGFDTTRANFSSELQRRGLQARVVDTPIDLEKYEEFEKPDGATGDYFDKDLKPLAGKETIDFLVLLSVNGFGTIRSYYGFIPLGAPQGYCRVSGRMIDLHSNQLMWRTTETEEDAMVTSLSPWDQEPNYPNLTLAINKAVTNAQEFLYRDFFGETQVARK